MPLPSLIEMEVSEFSLRCAVIKVVTRAAKRALEVVEAARLIEARKQAIGAARAAKKRKIATRPIKSERVVENTTRVTWF